MSRIPRFIAPLEERSPRGAVSHGTADLTYAAALALDAGVRWTTEAVPPTVEVCRAIPHEARMAAWRKELYSPGLPAAFEAFAANALGEHGTAGFSFRLSVYNAALHLVKHADWLMAAVSEAAVAPWPPSAHVSHPLTGEITPAGQAEALAGIPFAFGAVSAAFSGIDPAAFCDFLQAGDGSLGAADYLSHALRSPEAWFRDLHSLDRAARDWAAHRDLDSFVSAVREWNSKQDVCALAGDPSTLYVAPWSSGADEAAAWCADHARTVRELLESIKRG